MCYGTSKRTFTVNTFLNRHPGITVPYKLSRQWAVKQKIDPHVYTVDALPLVRTGGRGPDGKIKYKHMTTGLRRPWFMVDYNYSRHLATGKPYEELVLQIKKNWWRHPLIALVASGTIKRWIVATTSMRPGDVVCSHVNIPVIPVIPKEGDAYPIGALPVGTTICLIELRPGEGALYCRSAGTSASIIRRGKFVGETDPAQLAAFKNPEDISEEDIVLVKQNGNRKLLRLLPSCMVVVGQVSNNQHKDMKFRKFGEKYWRGIKQRSGLWQRKTGRFGRKIHPVGAPKNCVIPMPSEPQFILKCTLPGLSKVDQMKERALFNTLNAKNLSPIQPEPKPYTLQNKQPQFCWCSWSSVR